MHTVSYCHILRDDDWANSYCFRPIYACRQQFTARVILARAIIMLVVIVQKNCNTCMQYGNDEMPAFEIRVHPIRRRQQREPDQSVYGRPPIDHFQFRPVSNVSRGLTVINLIAINTYNICTKKINLN